MRRVGFPNAALLRTPLKPHCIKGSTVSIDAQCFASHPCGALNWEHIKKTGKVICVLCDARSACVFCVFFLITLIMKMGALSSYELIDQYSRCEDKLMK